MAAIKTISKEELSDALENGDPIQVVNVLTPSHYKLGSIEGSIKIPLEELDARIDELDSNQDVVTYCTGGASRVCRQAADKLVKAGFSVRIYEGGIQEWKAANLPMDLLDEDDLDDTPDAPSGLSGLPNSGRS